MRQLRHAWLPLLLALPALEAQATTPTTHIPPLATLRLFNTPAERQALDQRRRQPAPAKPAATPPTRTITLTLDGIVRRSKGPTLLWINGSPQTAHPLIDTIGNASVTVRDANGNTHPLPVGSSIDVTHAGATP